VQCQSTNGKHSQAESSFYCHALEMFQIRDLQGSYAAQQPAPKYIQGVLAWPTVSVWEIEVHKNKPLD